MEGSQKYFYESEGLRKGIEMDENDRSVDAYYLLLDLMNNRDKIEEFSRIELLLDERKDDITLLVKLGLLRRKFFEHNQSRSSVLKTYFKDGTYGEHIFKEAIKIDPYHLHILYNSCKLAIDHKDDERYERQWNLLKERYPNSPWTLFMECHYLINQKRYEEAIELLERRMGIFSREQSTLKYAMNNVCSALNHLKKTEEFYRKCEDFNKVWVPRSQWGLNKVAWYFIDKHLEVRGKEKKLELLATAEEIIKKSHQISTDGTNYNLGVVYYYREEFEKSVECLDRELLTDPYSTHTLKLKMTILGKLKKKDKAFQCADQLIRIDNSYSSHSKKAEVFETFVSVWRAIEYLEGKDVLKSVDTLRGDPYVVYSKLGTLYLRKEIDDDDDDSEEDRNMNRTIHYCTLSINSKPSHLSAYMKRAEAYLGLENYEKARIDFQHLIEHEYPYVDDVHSYLAWMYHHRLFEFEVAIYHYKKYIGKLKLSTFPFRFQFRAHRGIAECQVLLNRPGRAYRRLSKYISFFQNQCKDEFGELGEVMRANVFDEVVEMKEELLKQHGLEDLLRGRGWQGRERDFEDRVGFLTGLVPMKEIVCIHHGERGRIFLKVFDFQVKLDVL